MKKPFLILAIGLFSVALILFLIRQRLVSQSRLGAAVDDSVEASAVPAGDFVTVDKVYLTRPGFVMIHRAVGDEPAEIVMTGDLLPVGESRNVVVHTGVKTKSGEAYFAMLHFDNGNGRYDDPSTDPPVARQGQIVEKKFLIR